MGVAGVAVRVAVLVPAAAWVVLTLATVMHGHDRSHALEGRDGGSFVLPMHEGAYEASFEGHPVLVYVVPTSRLDAVDEARGEGEATPALELGDGLSVFAFSAVSNRLGCTGGFVRTLGASADVPDYDGDGLPDGRFMDPCHHGQWDVLHRGSPVPMTLTCGPLARLEGLGLQGGGLSATGFDQEPGPRSCEPYRTQHVPA